VKYDFSCKHCHKTFELEISIKEYDKVKDKQICPDCNSKLERVLSWEGFAIGKGDGWFGRNGGNVV
jgi:putative FmdB family regulatory protein